METNASLKKIPEWLKGNWTLESDSDSGPYIVVGADTIEINCQKKTDDWWIVIELSIPKDLIGPATETVSENMEYTIDGQTKGEKKLTVQFLLVSPNEIAPRFIADPWLLIDFGTMIRS